MHATCTRVLVLATAATLLAAPVSTALAEPFAYVPNWDSDNVSVIDTATNSAVSTIAVGDAPYGVGVNPAGTRVYVTNFAGDSVSVSTLLGWPLRCQR